MKDIFISINTLIVGAAIFGIIIATGIVVGTSYSSDTSISPMGAASTTLATSPTATSTKIPTIHTKVKKIPSPQVLNVATTSITNTAKTLPVITITPSYIEEGDPVMIRVVGNNASIENIQDATLLAPGPNMAGRSPLTSLHFTDYKNIPTAFYGTGIDQATGQSTITVTMKNGTKISAHFNITGRIRPNENLPVPTQIGGNSTSSQQQLVTNLSSDNASLMSVYSNPTLSFWTEPFTWPLSTDNTGIVITDPFGYNRQSGAATIIHKGTDFKASPGTPVYAINAGFVRVTKLFNVYGNTVVIDHGMGIQSFYMHLSDMTVTPGQAVKKGDLIGHSGETGYSEGPHLHLTIRIDGVSVDPMKFYALFGLTP